MTRQEHLLIIFMEECAEAAQRASKALRFGLQEVQPEQSLTNAARIEYETTDLMAVYKLMQAEGLVSPVISSEAMDAKRRKIDKYLLHSEACGTL